MRSKRSRSASARGLGDRARDGRRSAPPSPRATRARGVVAAPQRLGGVERRVRRGSRRTRPAAARARARARGRCRSRRTRTPSRSRERGEARGCARGRRGGTGAAARRAGVGAEGVAAAGAASARRGRRASRSRSGRRAPRRAPRASRERDRRSRGRAAAVARVRVGARVSSRQRLRQPVRVLDEQREVAAVRRASTSAPWIARSPSAVGRLRELHRAATRVVVGQRERVVAQLDRRGDELVGQRGAVEEREGGVGMELDVHTNTCSHSQSAPSSSTSSARSRPQLGLAHPLREPGVDLGHHLARDTEDRAPPIGRANELGAADRGDPARARRSRAPRAGRRAAPIACLRHLRALGEPG